MAELGVAAPQVVAHRLARIALAGPVLNSRDRKEFTGMVLEKQIAFFEAWAGTCSEILHWQQQFFFRFFTGAALHSHFSPTKRALIRITSKAIAPVHRKAVTNAKRLSRTKLR